jgi:hypothetical protein
MKRVSSCSQRAIGVVLICLVLSPAAFAHDAATDPSWWSAFIAWLQPGIAATAEDFNAWLEARIDIPPG